MPEESMNVAPWLQAFAAMMVAVLTYHLVKVTREYVRLTHELAQAARAQQEDQASQRAADHELPRRACGATPRESPGAARGNCESLGSNGRFSRRASYQSAALPYGMRFGPPQTRAADRGARASADASLA
jgi:hypothetical protein